MPCHIASLLKSRPFSEHVDRRACQEIRCKPSPGHVKCVIENQGVREPRQIPDGRRHGKILHRVVKLLGFEVFRRTGTMRSASIYCNIWLCLGFVRQAPPGVGIHIQLMCRPQNHMTYESCHPGGRPCLLASKMSYMKVNSCVECSNLQSLQIYSAAQPLADVTHPVCKPQH